MDFSVTTTKNAITALNLLRENKTQKIENWGTSVTNLIDPNVCIKEKWEKEILI